VIRVLVTRPRKEAAEFAQALDEIGAEAIFFPTIKICPVKDTSVLDRAISHLWEYDWLVLTSINAADIILDRKAALGIEHFPETLRVAAIGSKTAAHLLEGGITPHFTPEEYVAEAILPELGDLNGCWVLLPLADIAHDALPQAIQKANGIAHVVTAYHTLPAEPDPDGLAAIRAGVDIITFTSGSTARNFVSLIQQSGLDPFCLPNKPIIACIGPKTTQTAKELGFSVAIVASVFTAEGLVQAISNHLQKINPHDTI
jgi:uroporphyrinogen-III synthase